jgi:hypothetical protein
MRSIRSGGDARLLLGSSRRERLSSLAGFFWEFMLEASSSHSLCLLGGAVEGRSSRSLAAASAACRAALGGGAPPAMLGVPDVGWCSKGWRPNLPLGEVF